MNIEGLCFLLGIGAVTVFLPVAGAIAKAMERRRKMTCIYSAVLHTEKLRKELKNSNGTQKGLWARIYDLMDGERAMVAESKAKKGEYVFLGLEDTIKNKELWYLIEQDDVIGNDMSRDEFNRQWENGQYTFPDGCMYLDSYCVQLCVGMA